MGPSRISRQSRLCTELLKGRSAGAALPMNTYSTCYSALRYPYVCIRFLEGQLNPTFFFRWVPGTHPCRAATEPALSEVEGVWAMQTGDIN